MIMYLCRVYYGQVANEFGLMEWNSLIYRALLLRLKLPSFSWEIVKMYTSFYAIQFLSLQHQTDPYL
jgi:hypothetical protein